ncbi:1-deoxy-D-xylulose-5-phosphate reductoisomerase [Salidesulfovibrio onnuriiensis]|uniref:1-deoxy-D-xylulose-5-phosphate reductoisomerase n=1 Tax=Salidesulfovibrio onnuriiensis TaxID=2583823 RepID=UPI0011CA8137|nr:1-deoxy-D-xylulose-5-phosphate reductoisomerase [Salidesulfovibrio onnuriiensis]
MKSYISPWPGAATLPRFPRSLVILGATGSIGTSALKVVERHPALFRVTALAGGRNAAKLAEQAARFRPPFLAVLDQPTATTLRDALPRDYSPEILVGPEAYITLAELPEADLILSTIVGAAGFLPTLAAARAGKMLALANKESLVLGGHLIREACHRSGAVVLPVDSEHNALFQGLLGHNGEADLSRIILTASGGPFRGKDREFLRNVTRRQALAHPNWDMGAKISVDSSTLMNKGLEVIEACHLYGLPVSQVDVVVHPQSIVHSLVEYVDGSQLAHMGVPDMQIPIAHCLCFPKRVPLGMPRLDLAQVGSLTFEAPDLEAFPCLRLAMRAYDSGPAATIVLNAANEVAVDLFLKERIAYLDIPAMIEKALDSMGASETDTAEAILELDRETRKKCLATA